MTIHTDIDKIFKEGLDNYSEKAPAFVWNNIEQELNKKRIKRNRNLLYTIAASLAILLSFGAGYLFTDFSYKQIAKNDVTFKNNTPKKNSISTPTIEEEKPKTKQEPKAIINNTNETTIVKKTNNQKTVKAKSKKIDNPNSKVKKASSAGTLLPPIFTEANNYNESLASSLREESVDNNQKIELLTSLELKQATLNSNTPEKDLVYELRLIPLPPEPTKMHTTTEEKQWAIGLSGTPLLSYRNVQNIENEAYAASANTSGLQQNYANEKPLVSYSAGLNVNYQFSKRWRVQSGFYMSETGQVINNIDLAQAPSSVYNSQTGSNYVINSSSGNIVIEGNSETLYNYVNSSNNSVDYGTVDALDREGAELSSTKESTTKADFIQTLEYFELPVILGYKLLDKKLDINISGGVSANFLVNNTTYLQNNNNRQDINAEVEGIKSMNYSSILGIGLEYPLVERLLINLNPTLRYSINSVNSAGNVYPYSFGIYTGLKYNF